MPSTRGRVLYRRDARFSLPFGRHFRPAAFSWSAAVRWQRRRRSQIGLQQKKQSIGGNLEIEVYKTVHKHSRHRDDRARVQAAGEVTLVRCEGLTRLPK